MADVSVPALVRAAVVRWAPVVLYMALQTAEARNALLFFEHDATVAAGRVRTVKGKRHFDTVIP